MFVLCLYIYIRQLIRILYLSHRGPAMGGSRGGGGGRGSGPPLENSRGKDFLRNSGMYHPQEGGV